MNVNNQMEFQNYPINEPEPIPTPKESINEPDSVGMDIDESFLRYQAETESIWQLLKINLLGIEYDKKEKRWVGKKKPIINEKGYRVLFSICAPFGSKHSIMGNKDEKELKRQLLFISKAIINQLRTHWRDWKIDPRELDAVLKPFLATVEVVMSRGRKGRFMKAITGMTRYNEYASDSHNEEKSGLKVPWTRG